MKDVSEPELWESGRPKRACINRQKRISADERLVSDNKTYYKVEVLSTKLRSNDKEKECAKQKEAKPSETDKGLIVKFRKLRNSGEDQGFCLRHNIKDSHLLQNWFNSTMRPPTFYSPRKTTLRMRRTRTRPLQLRKLNRYPTTMLKVHFQWRKSAGNSLKCVVLFVDIPSREIDEVKPPDKFKVEDEVSMDSTSSDGKRRPKRRSHAEAFIMDNQKYYKFETPGSRLVMYNLLVVFYFFGCNLFFTCNTTFL